MNRSVYVTAAAEEQTVEEVDDSVGTLAEQAENRHATLERFEVADGVTDDADATVADGEDYGSR